MRTKKISFLPKLVFFTLFILTSLTVKAEVKVDFDNLPYVEDYWMLPAKEIDERANAGDPFAQDVLKLMHIWGCNGYLLNQRQIKAWEEKALTGLEKLAAEGNAAAQFKLGSFYTVRKDIDKTIAYWTQSAEQGYAFAQYKLGELYKEESAVANPERSAYWYKQSLAGIEQRAKQGNPPYMFLLIKMYEDGLGGLEKDEKKVKYWKEESVKGMRKIVAAYQEHAYNPAVTYGLINDYLKQFSDENSDASLLYKAYALTKLLKSQIQSDLFDSMIAEVRLDILGKDLVSEEKLEAFAQQCLKEWKDECY